MGSCLCASDCACAQDPYYFVDRNVISLFMSGACYLYLTQGLAHALLAFAFLISLRMRVNQTISDTVDSAVLGNQPGVGDGKENWKAHEIFGDFGHTAVGDTAGEVGAAPHAAASPRPSERSKGKSIAAMFADKAKVSSGDPRATAAPTPAHKEAML